MELTREGVKLKTKTNTEKEVQLRKSYNYLYHRYRQLLAVYFDFNEKFVFMRQSQENQTNYNE
jgi:hypothetical protein